VIICFSKSKSKFSNDGRSVGQSILVSGHHLGPAINVASRHSKLSLRHCVFFKYGGSLSDERMDLYSRVVCMPGKFVTCMLYEATVGTLDMPAFLWIHTNYLISHELHGIHHVQQLRRFCTCISSPEDVYQAIAYHRFIFWLFHRWNGAYRYTDSKAIAYTHFYFFRI
jgi:hypothetical protein